MKFKVSIVIPVLNSRKVFIRQLRHFKLLNLPDDVEIIFVDDGSNPPLKSKFDNFKLKNFGIYPTCDTRPWTQPCARNLGAKIADGEYLLMTDIDHILTGKLIQAVRQFNGDKMEFPRQYGVLSTKGKFTQDLKTLAEYGYNKNKLNVYTHTGSYAMRREIFWDIGGYEKKRCDKNTHPTHDDLYLHSKYKQFYRKKKCKLPATGPIIYVFPATGTDPKKLFHDLKR
jgi:glycosyltransferase involved in cell wall biosynthesis